MTTYWKLIESQPYICARCFNDKRLIEWIKDEGKRGNCSWCGARRTFVVHLTSLGLLFRDVAAIYTPSSDCSGEPISYLLQDHWDIFSERLLEKYNYNVHDLVTAILVGDLDPKEALAGPSYDGPFHSMDLLHTTLEEEWEDGVAPLLGKANPFADISIPGREEDTIDRIGFAVSDVGMSYPTDTILYRARIHMPVYGTDRFILRDLGAPPPEKARSQRANQADQPVLYMASDSQTALAEVRAWKGAIVAVGRMRIVKEASVLDLREPPRIESPFFVESLKWRIEANALLERFGIELSRPTLSDEPEDQYVKTQHLCDLVRNAGYAGIAYPSALGLGYNAVLFDPTAAEATEIEYFRIVGVQFASEPISSQKIYFDEDQ